MNNEIKYNGLEIEVGEKVVEAIVDNLIVYIVKESIDDSIQYVIKLQEQNYDSNIEYDDYILDEYETQMLSDKYNCYEFLIEYFNDYSCSYGYIEYM